MAIKKGMTIKQRNNIARGIKKRIVAFFGMYYSSDIFEDIYADLLHMCVQVRDMGINPDDLDLDKAAAKLVALRYMKYKKDSNSAVAVGQA